MNNAISWILIWTVIVSVLAQNYTVVPVENDDTVWVGILTQRGDNRESTYSDYSELLEIAAEMWVENMNKSNLTLAGKPYQVGLRKIECGHSNQTLETELCRQAVLEFLQGKHGRVDFIRGGWNCANAYPAGEVSQAFDDVPIMIVCGSVPLFQCRKGPDGKLPSPCQKEGDKRYKNLWSIVSEGKYVSQEYVNLLKVKQGDSMIIFYENNEFVEDIAAGARTTANNLNIPILHDVKLGRTFGYLYPEPGEAPITEASRKEVMDLVDAIITLNPSGVLGGAFGPLCTNVVEALWDRHFAPGSISLGTCVNGPFINRLGEKAKFAIGGAVWDRRLRGTAYIDPPDVGYFHFQPMGNLTSPERFARAFESHFLYQQYSINALSSQAPLSYMMYVPFGYALHTSNSLNKADWVRAMSNFIFQETYYGPVGFDHYGLNERTRFSQHQVSDDLAIEIVSPLGSATLDGPISPAQTDSLSCHSHAYL